MIMTEIAISKFKATCLAVLERVRRTGNPVIVTRWGVPVAEIRPPPQSGPSGSWLGSMQGTIVILDDIVSPSTEPESAWEALKD